MALFEHDIDLIDKFLQGNLNQKEGAQYQERMEDPDFAQEVKIQKDAHLAIKQAGRTDLKNTFGKWDQAIKEQNSNPEKGKGMSPWLKYILIGFIVGAASFLLYNMFSGKDEVVDRSLYAAHFESYPNIISPLQKGENTANDYQTAFQVYEQKDYTKAINLFSALDQEDEAVQFYQALSQIETNEIVTAKSTLKQISSNPNHRFEQAAQWYYALLFLDKDANMAGDLLEKISQTERHVYRKKAQALLQDLE